MLGIGLLDSNKKRGTFCNVVVADIVFDYRQKATRTFQYLQGDYYIAPLFLVSLFLAHIVVLFLSVPSYIRLANI